MLNNLLMLGSTRIMWLIRFTAFQGILLAGMLLTMEHALLAAAVLLIKGALLPGLLWRTRNRLHSHHRMRPRMHVAVGVLAGMGGLVLSLWLEARLFTLPALFPPLLLPSWAQGAGKPVWSNSGRLYILRLPVPAAGSVH